MLYNPPVNNQTGIVCAGFPDSKSWDDFYNFPEHAKLLNVIHEISQLQDRLALENKTPFIIDYKKLSENYQQAYEHFGGLMIGIDRDDFQYNVKNFLCRIVERCLLYDAEPQLSADQECQAYKTFMNLLDELKDYRFFYADNSSLDTPEETGNPQRGYEAAIFLVRSRPNEDESFEKRIVFPLLSQEMLKKISRENLNLNANQKGIISGIINQKDLYHSLQSLNHLEFRDSRSTRGIANASHDFPIIFSILNPKTDIAKNMRDNFVLYNDDNNRTIVQNFPQFELRNP